MNILSCKTDMATLDSLRRALRQKAIATESSQMQPLSESQYSAGFDILLQESGRSTYQDFIVPQLSLLLTTLFNSHVRISVLEVGPGPESVLGYLPDCLRRKIKRYAAFEPNELFATRLEDRFCSASEDGSPLPCLEGLPDIDRSAFALESTARINTSTTTTIDDEKFDVILFCHSMYGMKPRHKFIERALDMLVVQPEDGMVVVFHRDGILHLDGLACHRSASFPTGAIRVANNDEVLDCFTSFIAGFVIQDVAAYKAVQVEWRKVCRALGRREEAYPDHILFSSPDVMVAFNRHATKLADLTSRMPVVIGDNRVKNWEARLQDPTSIIRPKDIEHVQQCVRWALKNRVSLTVLGGGHSGHCLRSNVVSIDMSSFDQVHIFTAGENGRTFGRDPDTLVVVEAGCKSGDIVRKTMAAGLTVPLGARPSVGAGLWLQGGIGHLARLHGLACDAIVGAVVVSVASSQTLCIGNVPSQHQPVGALRAENDVDLLWAMKGAGTNFGIVISVTFKASMASMYAIRNWIVQLSDNLEAQHMLSDFDELLPENSHDTVL